MAQSISDYFGVQLQGMDGDQWSPLLHGQLLASLWWHCMRCSISAHLSVVAEWSKVLTVVPWILMVWFTLPLDTYQLRFVSWVFHVIFLFVHFISLYTLSDLRAFRKLLPYNMYLSNLRIANHILIKIL